MANSKRKTVVEYIRDTTLARIQTANGFNTNVGTRSRGLLEIDAVNESEFPAVFISRVTEDIDNITRNQVKVTLHVFLVCYVKNSTGLDALQADMDDFIEDVTEAIEYDRTLGGNAHWIELKTVLTDYGNLSPHGQFVVLFDVKLATEGTTQ